MATIELTQGKVTTVPDECYEALTAMGSWHVYKPHNSKTLYAKRNMRLPNGKRQNVYLHRVIWQLLHGEIPEGLTIDHRDRNGLNNMPDNLRLATRQQQSVNQIKHSNNTSGFIGVYSASNKYMAKVGIDGIEKYLGVFDRPEDAALARDKVALEVYGDFAVLNFPELKVAA